MLNAINVKLATIIDMMAPPFVSYYTNMQGRARLFFLDCFALLLILTL